MIINIYFRQPGTNYPRTMSAFRATRVLLQRLPESPHTYHYTEYKSPFMRKLSEYFVVNPCVTIFVADQRNLFRSPPCHSCASPLTEPQPAAGLAS